jgi:hypothetical protein
MKLPLTRGEFESIVATTTTSMGIPFDDNMRVMAISFFHSLGRDAVDFDPEKLGSYLYTAVSHDMTYHIGQEIHEKRQKEAEKKKQLEEQQKESKPALSVVEPV